MATTGIQVSASRAWFYGALRSQVARTVALTVAFEAILEVLWRLLLATDGGDLAAQDFWAAAAHQFPGSAYNFAWYGGLHVPSYSVGSPYLMAWIGVRPTLMAASCLAAGLTALIITASGRVRRPWIASLIGALGWAGNSISGRATFAVGMVFALAAVAVVFDWPPARRGLLWQRSLDRIAAAVVCAALATFGSPVAGLFLGLVAAGIWLTGDDELPPGTPVQARLRWTLRHLFIRRRMAAYCLGVPPVVVVVLSAILFPFSGVQPMRWDSAILPALMGLFVWLVAPVAWRVVRVTGLVYIVAVLFAWLVHTQIGTNVTRLGLIFGAAALAAALCSGKSRNPFRLLRVTRWLPRYTFVVLAVLTSLIWQSLLASSDAVHSRPAPAFSQDADSIVTELQARHANLGRVEVVPSRSHVEASTLAPYFTLARGWNRQADLKRNPLFYDSAHPLTPGSYRYWLDRWAVSYVVLPPGDIDPSSQPEADLIARGLTYLKLVWSDSNWRLYAVTDPAPLVAPPGTLTEIDEAHMTIKVSRPGSVRIRMLYSPWLGLVRKNGSLIAPPKLSANGRTVRNVHGCVTADPVVAPGQPRIKGQPYKPEIDTWTSLVVPKAGTYTIAAPYDANPGTACPTPKPATPDTSATTD